MDAMPRARARSTHKERSPLVIRIATVKSATANSLGPSARLLLRTLLDWLGNESTCWPSLRTLSRETGLSVRQLQRLLRELAWLRYQQSVSGSKSHNVRARVDLTGLDLDHLRQECVILLSLCCHLPTS